MADYYELGFADPPVDWDDARDLANSMVIAGCANAHLATVTKQGEQDVISGLMAETTTNGWLGGYQIQEGPFDPDIDMATMIGIGSPVNHSTTGIGQSDEPNDTPFGVYIRSRFGAVSGNISRLWTMERRSRVGTQVPLHHRI